MPKLHGVPLSPFVRKTRVGFAEKGVTYDLEPMLPFNVSEDYKRNFHPMGKIPCLEDDGKVIPDSSAILCYIDAKYPGEALYPSDPYERARAVWLEEYADSAAVNALGTVFFQKVVAPRFLNTPTDEAVVQNALEKEAPPVFDYLEGVLPKDGPAVGGSFSVADIAIASPFVNFGYAGHTVDAGRWPKLAAFVQRTHARPSYASVLESEKALLG